MSSPSERARGARAPRGPTDTRRPVIVSCAWCGLLSSDRQTWYRPPRWFLVARLEQTYVSHGICPSCFSKYLPAFPAHDP